MKNMDPLPIEGSPEMELLKREIGETLGVVVTHDDIVHAKRAADAAVQRKSAELQQAPLRRHLYLHHYCGPTGYMGLDALKAIHETAPQQGSHPEGEL